MKAKSITVVSGLPRSGTSMMMRMLEAGGMPILMDGIRIADQDNPRGYYEYERVKDIPHDNTWLNGAVGKAIKMASALLEYLPQTYDYNIILMRRRLEEMLASQEKMLLHRGKAANVISTERLAELSHKHLEQIRAWLTQQSNMCVIEANYNGILQEPEQQVRRICEFIAMPLDSKSMVEVIDPSLYRQRL